MRNVKKLLLLLCVLFVYTSLDAQTKMYFAVDGTQWVNKYDRDTKELLLKDKIDLDLRTALVAGRLGEQNGKENYQLLLNLFEKCSHAFASIRLADAGYEKLQNGELRFFLEQNNVIIKNGDARNGEFFNILEYAHCFNAALREYSFNADIVKKLADSDDRYYNIELIISDFTDRMSLVERKIETEIEIVEFREKSISDLYLRYEKGKERLEKLDNKETKKADRPQRR